MEEEITKRVIAYTRSYEESFAQAVKLKWAKKQDETAYMLSCVITQMVKLEMQLEKATQPFETRMFS